MKRKQNCTKGILAAVLALAVFGGGMTVSMAASGETTQVSDAAEQTEALQKADTEVLDAISSGQERIKVSVHYDDVNTDEMYEQLDEECQAFEESLDPEKYTPQEVEQIYWDYRLRKRRIALEKLYADTAREIAGALGIGEDDYSHGSWNTWLVTTLTPEQIHQAAEMEVVSKIGLIHENPEGLTEPETFVNTEPEIGTEPVLPGPDVPQDPTEAVFGDFNHDGLVNASDAAVILVYAAAHGAGTFEGSFEEYVNR